MKNFNTLDSLYQKITGGSEPVRSSIGHFNIFRLEDMRLANRNPITYKRRDYYKISLIVKGHSKLHYADKSVELEGSALIFTHPLVPYSWEPLQEQQQGFVCIFTEAFFNGYGSLKEFPVFDPANTGCILLSEDQLVTFNQLFLRLFTEIESSYVFKYDVLRNIAVDIIHHAQKIHPSVNNHTDHSNAAERITTIFMELLERIFPIEFAEQQLKLRSPLSFADQLNVHINHLNRALKTTTGKTTSQLIAERVLQEAQILLKGTELNITEIAWCLKFEEAHHFTAFFKKMTGLTPKAFRALR